MVAVSWNAKKPHSSQILTLALFVICSAVHAQTAKPVERIYAAPYDSVWKAVKGAVEDKQFKIVVDKKRDRILETDVFMEVEGDSVIDGMAPYGEVPFIPSAYWKWGQTQLKAVVKQIDTVVRVRVFVQLRAFDRHTTNKWEYFPSNGKIEIDLFDEIEKRLGR